MGETGVADSSDPSTIFLNPANAVGAPRAYLAASRMDWPDDFFFDELWLGRMHAGFASQGSGRSMTWGVDISLAKFDFGESILYEPDGTPIGAVESFEKTAAVALALSMPAGDRWDIRAGVAGKRWWAEYAPAEFGPSESVELDAYSFDMGVTTVLRSSVGDWRMEPALALAVIDAGSDFDTGDGDTEPLPTRFNFGTGLWVESPRTRVFNANVPMLTVAANVDATHPREGDFEWGIGSEIAVAQILFLRSGTRITEQSDDDETRSGWSVGLGVPVSSLRLRFDYTERDYNLSTKHMGVTASWLF